MIPMPISGQSLWWLPHLCHKNWLLENMGWIFWRQAEIHVFLYSGALPALGYISPRGLFAHPQPRGYDGLGPPTSGPFPCSAPLILARLPASLPLQAASWLTSLLVTFLAVKGTSSRTLGRWHEFVCFPPVSTSRAPLAKTTPWWLPALPLLCPEHGKDGLRSQPWQLRRDEPRRWLWDGHFLPLPFGGVVRESPGAH